MIAAFRAPDSKGQDAIAVVLSPGSVVLNVDGQPFPGVAVQPAQARELAYRLLLFAQEIENGRAVRNPSDDRTTDWSLRKAPN